MSRSGTSPEQRQQASEADAAVRTFQASGNFRVAGTRWDAERSPPSLGLCRPYSQVLHAHPVRPEPQRDTPVMGCRLIGAGNAQAGSLSSRDRRGLGGASELGPAGG